ncbi:MAG: hypothetical protein IK022_06825 [Bacteroidales bacterium]|nr:hypothetical protein [Bacteroidales bacterium]
MEQEKYLIRPGIKILGNYGLPETILLIFIIQILDVNWAGRIVIKC